MLFMSLSRPLERRMTSRPCILLVDYRPQSILSTGRMLESAGYDVRVAGDGVEALRVYDESRPDLVLILEAMLPKKHGFQVCREIKNASAGKVPVIIASAVHRGARYRLEATREHGCDEYIERPVPEEQFLSSVQKFLPASAGAADTSGESEIDARLERLFEQSVEPADLLDPPALGERATQFASLPDPAHAAEEEWERLASAVPARSDTPEETLPSLEAELSQVFGSLDRNRRGAGAERLMDRAGAHEPGGSSSVSSGVQRTILFLSAGIATVLVVVLAMLLMQSAGPVSDAAASSPAPAKRAPAQSSEKPSASPGVGRR